MKRHYFLWPVLALIFLTGYTRCGEVAVVHEPELVQIDDANRCLRADWVPISGNRWENALTGEIRSNIDYQHIPDVQIGLSPNQCFALPDCLGADTINGGDGFRTGGFDFLSPATSEFYNALGVSRFSTYLGVFTEMFSSNSPGQLRLTKNLVEYDDNGVLIPDRNGGLAIEPGAYGEMLLCAGDAALPTPVGGGLRGWVGVEQTEEDENTNGTFDPGKGLVRFDVAILPRKPVVEQITTVPLDPDFVATVPLSATVSGVASDATAVYCSFTPIADPAKFTLGPADQSAPPHALGFPADNLGNGNWRCTASAQSNFGADLIAGESLGFTVTVTEVGPWEDFAAPQLEGEVSSNPAEGSIPVDGGAGGYCGDGNVDAGEQCDDGNPLSGDGCSSQCEVETTTPICGNGIPEIGEECDDGNAVTEECGYGALSCNVCDANCSDAPGLTSYCSDGVVDAANGEQCDDGNSIDGDGCSSICLPETPPPTGNFNITTAEVLPLLQFNAQGFPRYADAMAMDVLIETSEPMDSIQLSVQNCALPAAQCMAVATPLPGSTRWAARLPMLSGSLAGESYDVDITATAPTTETDTVSRSATIFEGDMGLEISCTKRMDPTNGFTVEFDLQATGPLPGGTTLNQLFEPRVYLYERSDADGFQLDETDSFRAAGALIWPVVMHPGADGEYQVVIAGLMSFTYPVQASLYFTNDGGPDDVCTSQP